MKRLICFLRGHRFEDYNLNFCDRCFGYWEIDEKTHTLPDLWWWLRCLVRNPLSKLRAWCRPCSDCGCRFGRHDDTKEHLPF